MIQKALLILQARQIIIDYVFVNTYYFWLLLLYKEQSRIDAWYYTNINVLLSK